MSKIYQQLKRLFVYEKKVPVVVPLYRGDLLKGRTAFISGGSGGIGYQIAKQFLDNSCEVVISGTNEEKLKKISTELGEKCTYLVLDITNISEMKKTITSLLENTKIDICVNAAGVHGPANYWEITEADYDSVMDTNVKGMFFLSQVFASYMKEKKIKGHILNISSASALKPGKTPYEISKNAVKALTLGMADECIKYGIVVNGLAPGPTATAMLKLDKDSALNWGGNPSGRVATTEEIANWAVFLVSSLGDYIVGDSVYVTGGSGTICIDK